MEKVQMLWIGDELTKIEILSIRSFQKHGHDVHLYVYDSVKGIPEGVIQFDAHTIIPKDKIFKAHNGSYGAFSDLFRHILLYKKGGYWVDSDVVCIKPFDFTDEYVLCCEDSFTIATAVLKLLPGNPISSRVITNFNYSESSTAEELAQTCQNTRWGALGGPLAITKIYQEFKLHETTELYDPITFYPVSWNNWWALFFDKDLHNHINLDHVYGIHLWNNMFSTYKYFNKNNSLTKGSVVDQLLKTYL